MANEDLRSQLYQLQSIYNEIQREINRLNSELNALAGAASAATAKMVNTANNVRNTFTNSANVLDYAENQLTKTYQIQLQIKEMHFIFKDIETANKKIRALTNKLYFDFHDHSIVRKIVAGFIDNFDLNLISDETIYQAVEKQFLTTSDYWLSYVLMALMHWKEDNKEKAEECLKQALNLNKKSTAIFFMLFNLKVKRLEPALDWFEYYKDLEKTGTDNNTFLMFISSLDKRINEIEDSDELVSKLAAYIKEQFNQDVEKLDTSDIVSKIQNYYCSLEKMESIRFKNLNLYLKEARLLSNALSKAKNNQAILTFIEDMDKVHMNERNLYLNKYIAELINTPSSAEQVIIDEIHLNEEIIATMEPLKHLEEGQVVNSTTFKQMAKDNMDARIAHDKGELNFANEVVNWVYINKNNDINSLTSWNLFVLTKSFVDKAYDNYHTEYVNAKPKSFTIAINDYTIRTDFKNKDVVIKHKNAFCENKKERQLKKIKNGGAITKIIFGALLILACVAGFIVPQILENLEFLSLIGAVAGLIGIILLISGIVTLAVKNPKRRRQVVKNVEAESKRLEDTINQMFDEYVEYCKDYDDAEATSKYVYEKIESI